MEDLSILSNAHPSYIDSLYKDYLNDPETVEPEWRKFFAGFDFAYKFGEHNGHNGVNGHQEPEVAVENAETQTAIPTHASDVSPKEFLVRKLISGYRNK